MVCTVWYVAGTLGRQAVVIHVHTSQVYPYIRACVHYISKRAQRGSSQPLHLYQGPFALRYVMKDRFGEDPKNEIFQMDQNVIWLNRIV